MGSATYSPTYFLQRGLHRRWYVYSRRNSPPYVDGIATVATQGCVSVFGSVTPPEAGPKTGQIDQIRGWCLEGVVLLPKPSRLN